MEITELCLAPRRNYGVDQRGRNTNTSNNSSSSESENNSFSGKKRKLFNEESIQTSVDLHFRDPLPLDWEQCLDLQSGEVYYLNRKTLKKSWSWPKNKNQKLDLELNISVPISDQVIDEDSNEKKMLSLSTSSCNNMIALACVNCHLLVILSTSSPSCPNCKYVHSLPSITHHPANTLSLLN